ncbi:MAG: phage tail protein [Saprospiraceae bacterium]|nr:phage tail protein [Saprospiraceae bacterium]
MSEANSQPKGVNHFVSGIENQVIEYRESSNKTFSTVKMPGMVKYGNVTLKRGVFLNDNSFWDWNQQISMNTIERETVLIKLLDENGKAIMQWQLSNAWPTKITITNINSDGNEIAVDTIEIAYEQLVISNK